MSLVNQLAKILDLPIPMFCYLRYTNILEHGKHHTCIPKTYKQEETGSYVVTRGRGVLMKHQALVIEGEVSLGSYHIELISKRLI